jgi:2-amino-4-hydroxy-6-hydroxymethyldihydropteridine diphosphokinase
VTDGARAFLSLGSNLGERFTNLVLAVRALSRDPASGGESRVVVTGVSRVYETAALGPDGRLAADQPPFLNCAVEIRTQLGPTELRAFTARVEEVLGRGGGERWRPRTIDVDVVLYGQDRVSTETLAIPHPRMLERAFVLRPLADMDPELTAPGIGRLADYLDVVRWQPCVVHTSAEEFARIIAGEQAALGRSG